ncbi:multiple sugar transport system ATP-binding protein [Paracoccus isoporae]|uniref:Multiple sugar transport system ATP-binding protein n=1 Tax=Paracoccus isoporae TaxID=591205 RepID=A0A1G6ZJU9_9RHOB|nr:sn-glycerol-3-phosphate ABC transporter ATP-binding protein UgpC [Paracoccus isoporae]SDE02820.1 multiple sugar transport system ATP-binding protein [Paracoccus isoporae]
MAHVQIQNLKKSYGAVQVIHDIDVGIDEGEFVALVGPSGCGKSTLLRMIAGLEDVTGGTIRLNDRVINDVAPKDRDIAMVFQSYALYPHMTVEENMGFALKLARVPQAEIKARVAEAAATLNLTEYLDRHPRQLSGGQRQRVAMGRSIVRSPSVFLFDEPLSNLDAKLRVRMRTEIKALHQRLGATSVYVTHDQIEAMTMADKIVVMRAGRIEQVGAPLELYDDPANVFVATFIGSPAINLLSGRYVERDGAGAVDLGHGVVMEAPQVGAEPGQPCLFGIRPEHLEIAESADAADFTVEVIEPTGSETIITGRIAGQEVQMSQRERTDLKPGDVLRLRPAPGQVRLFDAETEARLK